METPSSYSMRFCRLKITLTPRLYLPCRSSDYQAAFLNSFTDFDIFSSWPWTCHKSYCACWINQLSELPPKTLDRRMAATIFSRITRCRRFRCFPGSGAICTLDRILNTPSSCSPNSDYRRFGVCLSMDSMSRYWILLQSDDSWIWKKEVLLA